mmetsp:Transcript_79502/g.199903  ORF Transcript_79502/g.199903 Transcript_79502/m.199903 type:complete len:228 (-) Transcript_79502:1548-2231(-)
MNMVRSISWPGRRRELQLGPELLQLSLRCHASLFRRIPVLLHLCQRMRQIPDLLLRFLELFVLLPLVSQGVLQCLPELLHFLLHSLPFFSSLLSLDFSILQESLEPLGHVVHLALLDMQILHSSGLVAAHLLQIRLQPLLVLDMSFALLLDARLFIIDFVFDALLMLPCFPLHLQLHQPALAQGLGLQSPIPSKVPFPVCHLHSLCERVKLIHMLPDARLIEAKAIT